MENALKDELVESLFTEENVTKSGLGFENKERLKELESKFTDLENELEIFEFEFSYDYPSFEKSTIRSILSRKYSKKMREIKDLLIKTSYMEPYGQNLLLESIDLKIEALWNQIGVYTKFTH